MATRTAESPTLSDERLADLLKLAAGADSVELKLTVPETALFATARALGMDPLDAQIRQVFFFDTPDLALNEQGVVVRARRVQGKRGDTVVKLRPVVPEDMPKELRQSPSFVDRARCHAGRPRLLRHAEEPRRQRGGQGGRARHATAERSSSPSSSARSCPSTPRTGPGSTSCLFWGRSP